MRSRPSKRCTGRGGAALATIECHHHWTCPAAGYPAAGGRAMTVGRNPYRGPVPAPPAAVPASGMPPSRFPGPPASGAALTLLTGMAVAWGATAWTFPAHVAGTDSLPIEVALPRCAAAPAPPPSRPPSPGSPLGTAAAAGAAAPPIQPRVLEIWVPKLPIPTLKYGRPSVL